MISNYFKTAIRNILRHKFYTVIIVLGLTIGIAVFGLVLTYVNYELSYDRFNAHYNSVYRLESEDWALLGTAYGPEIGRQFPEVTRSVRVSTMEGNEVNLKIDDRMMLLNDLVYADSGFFDMFSFRFIKGNPELCMQSKYSIVLTAGTAKKIFGDEDPINKTIKVNNKVIYTVTAVIADVSRFHLKVNAVIPFVSLQDVYSMPGFLEQYGSWNYYTYLLLNDHASPKTLASKINAYYQERFKDERPPAVFSLRPLKEIYFTHVKFDLPAVKANRQLLRVSILIAIFILIIACVNFVNLSIAKASARSREIGVRKANGADRSHLVFQFLSESVLYALIATELSLVLMELLRPVFNNLVQRPLTLFSLEWGWIVFLVLGIPLLIGLLAGIYPALYLTRFNALSVMKKEQTRGRGSLFFRRSLIVFQFIISTVLIIGTFTIYKQLRYASKADLGYSNDNVLLMYMNSELFRHIPAFKEMLLANPQIRQIALSTQAVSGVGWQESIEVEDGYKQFTYLGIDTAYLNMMEIKLVAGRNFRGVTEDSAKVIINKRAIHFFNLKEPVVGQLIGTGERRLEVLGVTDDFHFNSFHNPIAPLVMSLRKDWLSTINVKVSNEDLPKTISYIESVWKQFCPETLFKYHFLDQNYQQLYQYERRLGTTFIFLSFLAVFIACMGLLALSLFMAEQRIKEIGVRKTMGDTTFGIVMMFSREFGKYVLIAGIIAIPVAYEIMGRWLNTFAYRIKIDIWILAGGCLITLTVAIATVVFQTRRIAERNPVEALRYE